MCCQFLEEEEMVKVQASVLELARELLMSTLKQTFMALRQAVEPAQA